MWRILHVLLIVIFLAINTSLLSQTSLREDSIITSLNRAFLSREAGTFVHFLSPKFTIGPYPRPGADHMLQRIFSHYGADSMAVGQVQRSEGLRSLNVKVFRKTIGENVIVYLDENGEVLYVDLFDKLYGIDRNSSAKLKAVLPFKMENGAIVITGRLNESGRELKFMFDTGSDGLALKKPVAESLGLTVTRSQSASVVGGNMQVEISTGNTLYLDTLVMQGISIALFDELGDEYDGIIGCTLAMRYLTRVDFDKQVIELYNHGRYDVGGTGFSIDADFSQGIPMLPLTLKVGKKTVPGNFIFDSGANYYLIAFGPFVKKNLLLTNGFVPYFTGATVSMGKSTTAFTGNFDKLTLGNITLENFPGVLQAHSLRDKGWVVPGDGSVGIETLKRFNFTLDPLQHRIHFEPNENNKLPVDFFLGDVIFSFKGSSEVSVSRLLKGNGTGELEEGDIVVSINGVPAEKLFAQPDKVKQLQEGNKSAYKIKVIRNGVEQSVTL